MNKQHVEDSLTKIRAIFEKASNKIENLKRKERIPATKLAEELAGELGMSGPQLYPTLLFLIKDYPGVKVSKGAHGGIEKIFPDELTEIKEEPKP